MLTFSSLHPHFRLITSRIFSLDIPFDSDVTSDLITAALKGARSIFRSGYRYQKAGVVLADLRPSGEVQTDLFAEVKDPEESRKLMSALDGLNSRMVAGTLSYAAEGTRKKWKTKFERISPKYTTEWNELLKVN